MTRELQARLARLEEAARRRTLEQAASPEFWAGLEALAARGRGELQLASMSPREQAAHALFGGATREEAEEVAARLEIMGPPIAGLATFVRARIVTENRNEGRAVMGIPLLPLPGRTP